MFEHLNKEDIELIKNSMLKNSSTLMSEAFEYKEFMSDDMYEKEMAKSDRLIYLVNVLNGDAEYN